MCSIFLIFHSQITLQYMMQCLCFSFIYVRKKRESTTSYIFVNIESFAIYVNDPVFPQKGNIPASANLCHRPADSSMNKKMRTYWRCFGDVASKDEWVRDVCHFRRVSKTDSMPRPPPSNSPPPDSTQITTFKSEVAKVLSAAPPWSDQKLVTDKINFHFSSYGRVWSSRSWGDYPRKRVIGPSSQYHRHTLDWPGRITEGTKVVREEQICEVSSMCIVRLEGVGFMCF